MADPASKKPHVGSNDVSDHAHDDADLSRSGLVDLRHDRSRDGSSDVGLAGGGQKKKWNFKNASQAERENGVNHQEYRSIKNKDRSLAGCAQVCLGSDG